jgi:hypothetical protein
MDSFDEQLFKHKDQLIINVKVDEKYVTNICTTIKKELTQLNNDVLLKIENASPVPLELRIEELSAFNNMMDRMNFTELKNSREMVRTQVVVQNYFSFVYLQDNCFEVTKKNIPKGTLTLKICNFLLRNPVRAFRNSIAHGNWQYDFNPPGIKYFAHKGEKKIRVHGNWQFDFSSSETVTISPKGEKVDEKMSEFTVLQDELHFWQALSRATAYTIFTYILENKKKT